MKNLVTIKVKDKEDALKYAYAFMKSKRLYIKECSFINNTPNQYDKDYVFPRDVFSATYTEKNLPSWESFKSNPIHVNAKAFSCIASLDMADSKRVMCGLLENIISFNCYGNYEAEANKSYDEILSIHESLK